MSKIKDKTLKDIKRKIWWLELKIEWLEFISTDHGQGKFIWILPTVSTLAIYLFTKDFIVSLVSNNLKKPLSVIIFILLFLTLQYFLKIKDKKAEKKLKLLNEKLSYLHKQKLNLTN